MYVFTNFRNSEHYLVTKYGPKTV